MSKEKLRKVFLETAGAQAPLLLADNGYARNNGRCIISARVISEAAKRLDLSAKVAPVLTIVSNAEALKMRSRLGRMAGLDYLEIDAIQRLATKNGAYEIIGDIVSNEENRYPGHLVVILKDLLFDLDFVQFHRPHKNIYVPRSAVFPIDYSFWAGKEHVYSIGRGNKVSYKFLKDPRKDYRGSKDWKVASRWEPIVDELVKKVVYKCSQIE